ncbi:hypothetical protein LB507_002724 [Fusarium sp. FIESC RH6]|nr:hypothetical protein LB507_002724 [Fusarium sp. FIESC RH6]
MDTPSKLLSTYDQGGVRDLDQTGQLDQHPDDGLDRPWRATTCSPPSFSLCLLIIHLLPIRKMKK